MNKNHFVFSLLLVLFFGCSLEVKDSHAPTKPPQTKESKFSSQILEGEFIGETNVMFFWPDTKWDESAQSVRPMSFDEKVDARKTVLFYLEEKDRYQKQLTQLKIELDKKYQALLPELEAIFTTNKCYALCDPDDFFCEPDNSEVLSIDDGAWMTPSTPEEEQALKLCQENQARREGLEAEKKEELRPTDEALAEAAEGLLVAIGDSNSINEFSRFEFVYGNKICLKESDKENSYLCSEGDERRLYLKIVYQDLNGQTHTVSNFEDEKVDFKITDVKLNLEEGYLTFNGPWLSFESGAVKIGALFYDLEFNFSNGLLKADGDMVITDHPAENGRIGRFFSEGKLVVSPE